MAEPLSKTEIAAGYDQIADKLAMSPKFYRLCRRLLAPKLVPDSVLLDVGCGQGRLLAEFRAALPPAELHGLDISPKLIEIAQRNVSGGHFTTGDAENLTYPDGKFDAVVMTEVLEHLGQPVTALRGVGRILKPGGWLLMTVPNRDWFRYEEYNARRRRYQPVDDHWYPVAEVTGFLKEAGFELHRIRGGENLYFGGGILRLGEKLALAVWPRLHQRMKRALFLARKPTAACAASGD